MTIKEIIDKYCEKGAGLKYLEEDIQKHIDEQLLEFKKFCDRNELHLDTTTGVHSVLSAEELLKKFKEAT